MLAARLTYDLALWDVWLIGFLTQQGSRGQYFVLALEKNLFLMQNPGAYYIHRVWNQYGLLMLLFITCSILF